MSLTRAGNQDEYPALGLSVNEAVSLPRIAIESVAPVVEGGRFPAKGVAGRSMDITAVVFTDGHDKLVVNVRWRHLGDDTWHVVPMGFLGNDHWQAAIRPEQPDRYQYVIEAWRDLYASFYDELEKKYRAGVPIALELQEGEQLVREAE